jgi:protein O-mannosyl-transferase
MDRIACKSENRSIRGWIVCGLLLVAVGAVFGQTLRHGFVNYDDKLYIVDNRANVGDGLTAQSIGWAMRTTHGSMWGPVTWISHLLDCQLYGFRPWGHHLTNVLLHGVTTLLLFRILWRMTGNLWPSALVAALFAIHPLHVETVAWVSERKGLLSGLFFLLTLGAYVRFVRRPFSWWNYLLVIAMFALSLMSKPAMVTLPFLLLLLDYWPLGRMTAAFWRRLIVEKLPLLAVAIAACVVAPLAQGKAVVPVDTLPIAPRITNALHSYIIYIEKFFWPENLAPVYFHSRTCPPMWQTVGAVAILLAISAGAVAWRRRWPWLFVGWFWFLGTLTPMLGLVQIGVHSMADRYTYVTQIGLYIIVAWGLASLAAAAPRRRLICASVSTVAVLALMATAYVQTSYWRDSKSLWTHEIDCYPRSEQAYNCLGGAMVDEGRIDKAVEYFKTALGIDRNDVEALVNLGNIAAGQKEYAKAADYLSRAVKLRPGYVSAMHNYALALASLGETEKAVEILRKALAIEPDSTTVNGSLGVVLARRGDLDAAVSCLRKALEGSPKDVDVHNNLGMALLEQGKVADALRCWQQAICLDPHDGFAVQQLAWVMATQREARFRNASEAVKLAEWAVQLTKGQEPTALGTLAAAYAEAGRFPEAVKWADRAIAVADAKKDAKTANTLREQREQYRKGKPFREETKGR